MGSLELGRMLAFSAFQSHLGNLLRSLALQPPNGSMRKENYKPLSVFLRGAFIGCIIALALLAWLPPTNVPRTIFGGHAEHFFAYLGTSTLMGLAFQKGPRLTIQCALLIMYAAALEAGQFYSPGRQASFQDFAFGAAGAVGGLLLLMARTRVLSWLRLD